MRAFLTGSRRYGTPREDSDIDVVLLCEDKSTAQGDWLAAMLWKLSDQGKGSCRYGRLNLLTFTNEDNFNKWKAVTENLETQRPVSREQAIEAFRDAGFLQYGEDKK